MNARLLIPVCLAGLTIGVSAKDDASLEGVVQLPPPTMERALNQRYGTNVEAPLTPSNPPAAGSIPGIRDRNCVWMNIFSATLRSIMRE